ncbi:MAG: DUF61 family protein [Promethearchaeota archaeon]
MSRFNGFLSRIEREIGQLNEHMPRTKKSLGQFLSEEDPIFMTRDGQPSAVRKEELEFLAGEIPSRLHRKIMIPFTIIRRTSMGRGAHTIGGSKLEQFTLLRILGKVTASFDVWRETPIPEIIYSPEVTILRTKLRTTTVVGFAD